MNKWIAIKKENILKKDLPKNFEVFNTIHIDDINLYYETDDQFKDDNVFYKDDRYLIVIDGVMLNLKELKERYMRKDLLELTIKLYEDLGSEFFAEFRGAFCGLFYDIDKKLLLSFTNQTGDCPVFVYNEDVCVISSDLNLIVSYLKNSHIKYTFNDTAANYMLSFGYMIDKCTFINEINRVTAGRYISIQSNKLSEDIYHKFNNERKEISFEDAIELVDEGFKKAVKRCFDKNLEYGYTQLVDMSAGMDSRMVNWVAREDGYENLFNISYSQFNSTEHKIAAEVAYKLKNQFLHKSLDDISFLYEIDEILKLNYGLTLYFGITGGNQLLRSLNWNNFGVEITGQLGDVVIGTFCAQEKDSEENTNKFDSIRYSNILNIDIDEKLLTEYENLELQYLYSRGFLGALGTHIIRRNYTYAVSPFLDVDFMQLCLNLPVSYRLNHKLYWAWVNKKHPDAEKIKTTRQKYNISKMEYLKGIPIRILKKLQRASLKALGKAHIIKYSATKNGMNPFQYWYETNTELGVFMEKYYNDNIGLLDSNIETKRNIQHLYTSPKSGVMDKLMVLTVLGVLKTYFGDCHEKIQE